jgi:hypothetical protein
MTRLFLQGIPTAFIFIPIAVLIMGRVRPLAGQPASPAIETMPLKEWLWKLGVIYILSGVYTQQAISSPGKTRKCVFYGSPGDARPFFQQMAYLFVNDPC